MRELPQAPRADFDVYVARPGTRWVEREEGDSLEGLYARGLLPYSGAKDIPNVFYSARSARVLLPDFALTSENRRIAKKFDGRFVKRRLPAREFTPDEAWYGLWTNYFKERHGPNVAPRERIEFWLRSGLVSSIIEYREDGRLRGSVMEVEDGSMCHFWYSAYDPLMARQSLGLWLMLDAIRDARERGVETYYLGTVYGEKALYKTNFEPLEWWDKAAWSGDVAALKKLSRQDTGS